MTFFCSGNKGRHEGECEELGCILLSLLHVHYGSIISALSRNTLNASRVAQQVP